MKIDQEKIDKFRQQQLEDKKRKEEMDALKGVSTSVENSAKETKRQLETVTKDIAKSSDIQAVIKELKETQLASYLGGMQKQSVILADSTDLGKAVDGLGAKLDALATSLQSEKSDTQLITTVKEELGKVVTALNQDTDSAVITAINDLKSALNIEVNPVVNVPEPVINLDVPKVDLKPLSAKLDAVVKAVGNIKMPVADQSSIIEGLDRVSKTINDLTFPVANFVQDPYIQYKAVDEFDDGVSTSVKYYGFLEPRGNWYILKNDPSASAKTYRYAFGDSDYETAWTNRASLTYGYPFGK